MNKLLAIYPHKTFRCIITLSCPSFSSASSHCIGIVHQLSHSLHVMEGATVHKSLCLTIKFVQLVKREYQAPSICISDFILVFLVNWYFSWASLKEKKRCTVFLTCINLLRNECRVWHNLLQFCTRSIILKVVR